VWGVERRNTQYAIREGVKQKPKLEISTVRLGPETVGERRES